MKKRIQLLIIWIKNFIWRWQIKHSKTQPSKKVNISLLGNAISEQVDTTIDQEIFEQRIQDSYKRPNFFLRSWYPTRTKNEIRDMYKRDPSKVKEIHYSGHTGKFYFA